MRVSDIDFLIIGATKSATTWLQRSLQADPSVCMPDPEIHYFSRNYHLGDDWYVEQFPTPQHEQRIGEKSNSYLDTPGAANRIATALPRVKLIAQLRNPIERAYSDYCMLFRRGEVGARIEEELDPRHAGDNRFLFGGRYVEQLKHYFERFDSDQILLLLYEETRDNPDDQIVSVRHYLDLKGSIPAGFVQEKVKDKAAPMIPPALKPYLDPLKPVVRPLRDGRSFKFLHGLIAHPVKYPPLSDELRKRMLEYYAVEMEELGKIMKRDLSDWLQDTPSTAAY